MNEYWNDVKTDIGELGRGMFLIIPLKYEGNGTLPCIQSDIVSPVAFEADSFIEMMNEKCRDDKNFVHRYKLDAELSPIKINTSLPDDKNSEISVNDLQLFVFYNSIAFLSVYLAFKNCDVGSVYSFINPGYTQDADKIKKINDIRKNFLAEINDNILRKMKPEMTLMAANKDNHTAIIKDAYRMNVAYAPKRFKDTDILNKITYNEHRLIELQRKFEDLSEKDVEYATGAKDVNSEDYGWGCCITSQEISFVYAKKSDGKVQPLEKTAEEDLLLTLLAIYQKYSCYLINEAIHERHVLNKGKGRDMAHIRKMKKEAMEFIAYGTLVPSQISRWNNVCEIYSFLLELTGVNEVIVEIKEKIDILNEEQDTIASQRETKVSMIIAVFGLISILAAVLQVADYVSTGRLELLISFIISLAGISAFGAFLLGGFLRRKK